MTFIEQAKSIQEKVGCAYLNVIGVLTPFSPLSSPRTREGEIPILLECRHNVCGPQHGCDVYDGKECKYKSAEIEMKFFYDPFGI